MSAPTDDLWWAVLLGAVAIAVVVGGLLITMVVAHRRQAAQHRRHTQRLLEVHEEERTRVAREVHDDAVQRLGLVQHELSELEGTAAGTAPELTKHIIGIQAEVRDLTASLRQLAHRLHPSVIDHGGLGPALDQLAEEMRRAHGLHVTLDLPSPPVALPREAALTLFRIAQESLSNVVKHAGVLEATVALRHDGESVEFRVSDAGKGFAQGASSRHGLGQVGMKERAGLIKAVAKIVSAEGQGTQVIVRVPMPSDRQGE